MPVIDGVAECPDVFSGMEYLVWPDIQKHEVSARYLSFQGEEVTWRLSSADGLRVRVEDANRSPVEGIAVRVFYSVADTKYLGYSWREKLQRKFFFWEEKTNAAGEVLLGQPLSMPMTVACEHIDGLNFEVEYEASDGDHIVLMATRGFSVYGKVVDGEQSPVAGGFVGFLYMGNGRTEDAGSTKVKEDGTYVCTDVSAEHPAILAVAFKDGFAVDHHLIQRPRTGDNVELNFVLNPAIAFQMRFVTPSGVPLHGIDVMASRDGYDWVPGMYTSDQNGLVSTDDAFVPGEVCLLQWWSDYWRGPEMTVLVPTAGEVVDVVLPPMGSFSRLNLHQNLPVGLESFEVEFHPRSNWDNSYATWIDQRARSPWIPTGPCTVSLVSKDGMRWDWDVVIGEGDNGLLTLPQVLTDTLRFELPEPEDGPWEVRLLNSRGYRSDPIAIHGGGAEIPISVGRHALVVADGSPRGYCIGPFDVPSGGLDLGLLQLEGGGIEGAIRDHNATPWSGIQIELHRSDGWYGGEVTSDELGRFQFSGISPGAYKLFLKPSSSHLLFQPNQIQEVGVHSGEWVRNVDFELSGMPPVWGKLMGAPQHPLRGFHAVKGWLETSPVKGDHTFSLSPPSDQDYVGAFCLSDSLVRIYGADVESGQEQYEVDAFNTVEREVRLVDQAGQALPSAFVTFRLRDGASFPGGASADAEGVLRIDSSPALPLEALFQLPGGGVEVYSVAELPMAGDLMLGMQTLQCEVHCEGLDGIPVAGVTLWNQDAGLRAITDRGGVGRIHGPPGEGGLRIEKFGYWPLVTTFETSVSAILRRRVDLVELRLPEGLAIERLQVEAGFSVGTPMDLSAVRAEEEDSWLIRSFPEGEYRLRGWNGRGELVLDEVLAMLATGPAIVQVR